MNDDKVVPVIKSVEALTVPDIETHNPDKAAFRITLDVTIGEKDKPGDYIFYLTVVSPEALSYEAFDVPVWGRGLLIVTEFKYHVITKMISAYCATCTGRTWDDVIAKLCRVMRWEYDGYPGV